MASAGERFSTIIRMRSQRSTLKRRIEKSERELERLISLAASREPDSATKKMLNASIDRRSEELENLHAEASTSQIRHLPEYNAEDIVRRLKSQLATLRESLIPNNAEAARARQVVRGLIDKIKIYPIGEDDGRGSGPVRIVMEGQIIDLLRQVAPVGVPNRVVQWDSDMRERLKHAIWSASTVVESTNKVHKTSAPTNTELIVRFLREASDPESAANLATKIRSACGLRGTEHDLFVAKTRVERALGYLQKQGVAAFVILPGVRRYRWLLTEREQEFFPKGLPSRASNFAYSDATIKALQTASAPITGGDIVKQIVTATGERARSKRLRMIDAAVRACLHDLRQKGVVLQLTFIDVQKTSWILAARSDELCPGLEFDAAGAARNIPRVLTILGSTDRPITARAISDQLLALNRDAPTKENQFHMDWRVRHHLRRYRAEGLARPVKIEGNQSNGWLLTAKGAKRLKSPK